MSVTTWIRRVAVLVSAIGVVLVPTARAQVIDYTINGDNAAWDEAEAASKKLESLSGYRLKRTTIQGGKVIVLMVEEVVPPKSFHATTEYNGSGKVDSEGVRVNEQYARRTSYDKQWKCSDFPQFDPSVKASDRVDVSRGSDTEIEGTPVHTYLYTETLTMPSLGKTVTWKTTLYVGIQTGLPRRMIQTYPDSETTTDYYDYGAKIEITLPQCK